LFRPLCGCDERLVQVVISQHRSGRLRIACDRRVDRQEADSLRQQVTRMFRLDEDFRSWHRVHPAARRQGFGRLFRSPTLFEDMVKTITTCNVTWPNTMHMNTLLCRHVGGGGFPTPRQLAKVRVDTLKRRCKVGYRARSIVGLARRVARGELDLKLFEDRDRSTDDVFRQLLLVHGIGPYGAANLCQLLGRYDRVAIDTETYRHFRQQHGVATPVNPKKLHRRIEAHYARYAPYQFLAYWFELWCAYEKHAGDARNWDAQQHGPEFTAAKLK